MSFYPKISAQETKQKNKHKQSSLLTLAVLCEKTSCFLEAKRKGKTKRKEKIKKSLKVAMEAIIVKIIIAMKIGNDSKSEHLEKRKKR